MTDEEPPASNPKITSLEKIVLNIQIQKKTEPILNPKMFNGKYTSIRNPGAFVYNRKYGLLCTIRDAKDKKSRLYLAWSNDGEDFLLEEEPFINLDSDSQQGVEDARISKIEEEYFITFTAFKGYENRSITTRIGLVKTKDFKGYYNRRIILDKYRNNKNGVVFRNGNYFYVIHRPFNGIGEEKPSAKLALTTDFVNFEDKGIFLSPRKGMWDDARVGINTPPIKLKHENYGEAHLFLYHGADKKNVYGMGYVLADSENPKNIFDRSTNPLLSPELWWETQGGKRGAEVSNVVFGCGAIPIGENKIRTYYGGADRYTGFADLTIQGIRIKELPL